MLTSFNKKVDCTNKLFKKYVPQEFSVSISKEIEDISENNAALNEIFEQTIKTSIQAISHFLVKNHVSLIGVPQSDKTATQYLAGMLFQVMYYLKYNRFCLTMFICPHSNAKFHGQLSSKFSVLNRVVKKIKVQYNKKELSVEDYLCKLKGEIEKIKDNMKKDNYFIDKEILGGDTRGGTICFSISKSDIEDFSSFIDELNKNNIFILIVRDEIHLNAKEESISDKAFDNRFLEEEEVENEFLNSVYDLFNTEKKYRTALFCGVSATNFKGLHLENVFIEITKDYNGFPLRYPLKFPVTDALENKDTYFFDTQQQPEYISLSKLEWFKNYDDVPFAQLYLREDKFYKCEEVSQDYADHEEYKDEFAHALLNLINYLFAKKMTTYNADKDTYEAHNGMLIRFCNDNNTTRDLMQRISKINKDKNLSFYEMFDDTNKSIKEFYNKKGILLSSNIEKHVLFATAGARSADSFDRRVGYGIDFTNEAGHWTSFFQGVIGRLSGYFKNPFLIITDKNAQALKELEEKDWNPWLTSKPLACDKAGNTKRKVKYQSFYFNQLSDNIFVMKKEFLKKVKDQANYSRFGKKCSIDIKKYFKIADLEEYSNAKLIPFSSIGNGGDEEYVATNFHTPCLAQRKYDNGDNKGGNEKDVIIIRFKNKVPVCMDLKVYPPKEKDDGNYPNKNNYQPGKINNKIKNKK
jgi:hypothetical protein